MSNEDDIREYFDDEEWNLLSDSQKAMFTNFSVTIDIFNTSNGDEANCGDLLQTIKLEKNYNNENENYAVAVKEEPDVTFQLQPDINDCYVREATSQKSCFTSEMKILDNNNIQRRTRSNTSYISENLEHTDTSCTENLPNTRYIKGEQVAKERKSTSNETDLKGNRKKLFLKHINDTNGNQSSKKKFNCSKCTYQSNIKCNLTRHNLIHGEKLRKKKFVCTTCSYQTDLKCNLERHCVRKETHLKLNTKESLIKHINIKCDKKLSGKRIRCSKCTYQTDIACNFKRHMLTHHARNKSDLKRNTKNTLVRSINIKCDDELHEKKFSCLKCSYQTDYKCNFKQHILRRHSKNESDLKTKANKSLAKHITYTCQRDTTYNLKGHIVPDTLKPYQCKICYKTLSNSQSLIQHKLVHNKRKLFSCDSCDYTTNYKKNLQSHTIHKHNTTDKYNTYENQHVCAKCGYHTSYKHNLKRHMELKHSNTNSNYSKLNLYKCNKCDFKSKYKHCIQNHIMLKHGTYFKEYKCTKCAYESKYKHNLKRHLNTKHHVGDMDNKSSHKVNKFHKCAECDFKTKYKGCLHNHVIQKHNR